MVRVAGLVSPTLAAGARLSVRRPGTALRPRGDWRVERRVNNPWFPSRQRRRLFCSAYPNGRVVRPLGQPDTHTAPGRWAKQGGPQTR
jgi:hypothetical protein